MPTTPNSASWSEPGSVVGREDERARLLEILDEVERGSGQFVLISGEAGIGKTALVNDVIAVAEERSGLVLTGHSYEFLSQTPYAPWLPILRSLLREADQPLRGVDASFEESGRLREIPDRDQFFESVNQLLGLAARRRPVVLFLEDLHWADQASLDLLRFTTRYPIEHPLLVIGSYRDDELDQTSQLYPILPSLIRDGRAARIHLPRLLRSSVEAIILESMDLSEVDRQHLTDFIHRLAEGNPFYTQEMLRSLELDGVLRHESGKWVVGDLSEVPIPGLVKQMIDARLAMLSPESRSRLEVAAVIGGDIPLDLWQQVAAIDDQQLTETMIEASQAHLLTEVHGTHSLRFSHELVREALYQGILLPRRRSIHRLAGETLEADAAAEPSVVANHFRSAHDPRATEWHFSAGVRAHAVYAMRVAIAHLSETVEHPEHLGPGDRKRAYAIRANAYQITGDFERAQADLELVLELARNDSDQRTEWQALIDLGMHWAERDYRQTLRYLSQALDLARATSDASILGTSLNRMGNWHLNNEDPSQAEAFHLEALESFSQSGDEAGVADTLDLLGVTRYLGGNPQLAASHYREAISLFRKLDRRQGLSSSLVDLMLTGGSYETITTVPALEPGEDWIAYGEEAIAIARDIGWLSGEAFALSQTAFALGLRGSYQRALSMADKSLEIANSIGHHQWITAAHLSLGGIYLDLLLPEARVHLGRSRALSQEINSRFWYRMATGLLARHYHLHGDVYRARSILDDCLVPDTRMVTISERICWLTRAELELAGGDADTALDILARLIDTAQGNGQGDVIPELWNVRCQALLKLNRPEEAIELLRAARDWSAGAGWTPTLWRLDVTLARAYSAAGAGDDASTTLTRANATVEELAGNIPDGPTRSNFLAQARARFPDNLRATARRQGYSPLDLTSREVEILRLVAEGHTDREIAEMLSISPRTVMNHVSNIFNKLGVNSRAAAAAHAIRNQLI